MAAIGLIELLKILFDFLDSDMVGGFERTDGCAENLRHLLIGHFVEIAHVEHKALLLRKLGNGLSEFEAHTVAVDMSVGFDGVGQRMVRVIESGGGASLLLFEEGQTFVYGYFVEPCRELGRTAKHVD